MRSTRGKSRAIRAASTPHFTEAARITAPKHSTERDAYGNHELPAGVTVESAGARTDFARINSNARLKDGGISSFYRTRERGYSA